MSLNSQVLDRPIVKDLPSVEANLTYLLPSTDKLFSYVYEPPSGVLRSNGSYQSYKMPIYNARSIAQNISLDREGFAFTQHHTSVGNFYDEEEIRQVYYPEAKQLLKEVTGATEVAIFDYTLRNAALMKQDINSGIREPVKRVHNDFTASSGHRRARRELAAQGIDNIDSLLQRRFAIINVWRGIGDTIQESPLTLCDAQSVAPTDLVVNNLIYRDRIGETYAVTYNPKHKWYYFPQMQKNEAVLIKCFDSAEDASARFALHTAFEDPTSPANAPPRESIELRTFVFYPD
ncbi:MAG: CmcJ/NvfI family oxidoreductase [Nostoc sp. ChiSLP01]|nr:CmcJ/NvfI family oxidoreductase [Nostoc sp. CmiSLP01]MDZ8288745.1 CmcJ/NvfI family oxidoreductase [Nostoc sp. ChiSLP01]